LRRKDKEEGRRKKEEGIKKGRRERGGGEKAGQFGWSV